MVRKEEMIKGRYLTLGVLLLIAEGVQRMGLETMQETKKRLLRRHYSAGNETRRNWKWPSFKAAHIKMRNNNLI
jgi:hypothetical protein